MVAIGVLENEKIYKNKIKEANSNQNVSIFELVNYSNYL